MIDTKNKIRLITTIRVLHKQVPAIMVLLVFLSSSLMTGVFQGGIITPAFSKENPKDDTVKTDTTTATTKTKATETDKAKTTDPTTPTDKTTKPKPQPITKKDTPSSSSNDNKTKSITKKETTRSNSNDNKTKPTDQTSQSLTGNNQSQSIKAQTNSNQSIKAQSNANQSNESVANTNTNASDPLACSSKDLLKCYFKMTTHLTIAPGEKYSDFKIHVTQNPRHIADFTGSKSSVKYLLPGNYAISLIYKGGAPNPYCDGVGKAGDSITCPMVSPNMPPPPPGPGELHVAESVKFVNGSFAGKPSVKVGTITVKGNNPHPAHFQLSSGDDEEGIFVKLDPGKYSASISLPSGYKLAGTDGHCSGVINKGGYEFCHFAVQQTAKSDQTGNTTPPPPSSQPHTSHTTRIIIKHESPVTENYIKTYISTNPEILRQVQQQAKQQPTSPAINSVLIPLNTTQLCRQAGDQQCVLSANNFKILAANLTKDVFGSWSLNGLVQNNSTAPLNQIKAVLQLYNSTGKPVGSTQGLISPQNLSARQNGIFFLQIRPPDLIGVPKFYRITFDYL
jgi:hypothetical protein